MPDDRKRYDERDDRGPRPDEQTRTYVPTPNGDPIPLEEVSGSGILPPLPADDTVGGGRDEAEEA